MGVTFNWTIDVATVVTICGAFGTIIYSVHKILVRLALLEEYIRSHERRCRNCSYVRDDD